MQPSETTTGSLWLENFPPRDQAYARLLIDSLHFASTSLIMQGLTESTDSVLNSSSQPSAIYPIRDVRDLQRNLEAGKRSPTPVMFENGVKPNPAFAENPGSEGIVSVEARNFRGKGVTKPGLLDLDVDLESFRRRKCRNVVFWEDFSGSGSKIIKYLSCWARNRTIQSWRSFGWLRIHLVIYAATQAAEARIRRSQIVDYLHVVEAAPAIATASWTRHDVLRIESLCNRFAAERTKPLGYGSTGGLFVMEHTVPNNLPAILTQDDAPTRLRGKAWNPFLSHFSIPVEIRREVICYRPVRTSEQVLARAGSTLDAGVLAHRGLQVERIVQVLTLVNAGYRQIGRLALELALPLAEAEETVARLQELGLLTLDMHVTDEGREEARRAGFRKREVRFALEEDDSMYYPGQLRGVGDV